MQDTLKDEFRGIQAKPNRIGFGKRLTPNEARD